MSSCSGRARRDDGRARVRHRRAHALIEHSGLIGGTTARSSGTLWIPDSGRRTGDTSAAYSMRSSAARRTRAARGVHRRRAGDDRVSRATRRRRVQAYPGHPDYRQELPGAAQGGGHSSRCHSTVASRAEFAGRLAIARANALRRHDGHARRGGAALARRHARDRFLGARSSAATSPIACAIRAGRASCSAMRWSRVCTRACSTAGCRCGARRRPRLVIDGGCRGVVVRRDGKECACAPGAASCSPAADFRRAPPCASGIAGAGRAPHARVRRLRRRHAPARPGGRRRARPLRRGQRTVVSRVGRDAGRRHDRGIPAHRARPRQAGADRRRALAGRRFTDEAVSYHEFTRAMYRTANVPAWLVCDRRFVWRYGLGMIRPMTLRLGPMSPADTCGRRIPSRPWRAPSASHPRDWPNRAPPQRFRADRDRCRFRQGRERVRPQQRRPGAPAQSVPRGRSNERLSMRFAWSRCRSVRASGCAPT